MRVVHSYGATCVMAYNVPFVDLVVDADSVDFTNWTSRLIKLSMSPQDAADWLFRRQQLSFA